MTTPTQLAKSQQEAEDYLREKYGAYRGHFAWRELEVAYTTAYLRAKQETEQAIKDARKQALEDVIQCINSERGGSSDNLILAIERLLK